MLFIDNQKVSESQFISEIEKISGKPVDMEALRKSTTFTYNEVNNSFNLAKFKTTGKKIRNVSQGGDVLSSFRKYDHESGIEREFRYAKKTPYADLKNGGNLVYEPRAIDISSGNFSFQKNEIDLALYILVHPDCYDSPFRESEFTTAYKYSHVNVKKDVEKKNEKVLMLEKSLLHASRLEDQELLMFAKGLGVPLEKSFDSEDVRGSLKSWAMENTELYYKAMQTEVVKFMGMIQDALDNRYIISRKIADHTVFLYDKGINKGSQITTVPQEVSDDIQYLKTYLGTNISTHYDALMNLNKEAFSELSVENFLASKKEGLPKEAFRLPTEEESDVMTLADVVDHQSAKKYLRLSHFERKDSSQAKIAKFLKSVTAKEITDDNIEDVIVEYIAK